MNKKNTTRRNFLKKTAVTTGALGFAGNSFAAGNTNEKLPREVWLAGISQMDISTVTSTSMVDKMIAFAKTVSIYRPDAICLPEVFPTSNIENRLNLEEKIKASKLALQQFAQLAEELNCYIICPVYTTEGNKAYNSAVVLNREGGILGEYRKIHLTEGEIEAGLTPGPLTPPVFQTNFGKIGVQICFDIEWDDGWTSLSKQGVEIVFWPSAFAGGEMVNTKAWRHKYVVASSTRKNTSKLCDISGKTIAKTGIWDKNMYCAPVNLEKVFLHTWPYVKHFDDIRKKYGRQIRITNFHEEEWSIIESLSPNVFMKDIMKEYGLKSHIQHTLSAEAAQIKARKMT